MDGQANEDLKSSTEDMTIFVQNLLSQMQNRFQTMSEALVEKNDMGSRIAELEQSINNLKAEMGAESAAEPKPEDTTPTETTEDGTKGGS